MAYRFKASDTSVQDGLRRIACDQIDKAIRESHSGDGEAVHDVRKRCKKLRGLLRLVRPAMPDYAKENAAVRDIACAFAALRDAEVMVGTYDRLAQHYEDQIDRNAVSFVRRQLTMTLNAVRGDADLGEKLASTREALLETRHRAEQWKTDRDGFAAIEGGLAKTYKRARSAMERAAKRPSGARFHDWRKRVKYNRYHAQLLSPVWPGMMAAHVDLADELGDVLGEQHDLVVFRERLAALGEDKQSVAAMRALAGERADIRERRALKIGATLFSEPTSEFVKRIGGYWMAWESPSNVVRFSDVA